MCGGVFKGKPASQLSHCHPAGHLDRRTGLALPLRKRAAIFSDVHRG